MKRYKGTKMYDIRRAGHGLLPGVVIVFLVTLFLAGLRATSLTKQTETGRECAPKNLGARLNRTRRPQLDGCLKEVLLLHRTTTTPTMT